MKKELNKNYVIAGLSVVVIALLAMCCMCCCKGKIATVNAQMIVSRSAAIRNLQHEQQLQYEELQKWLQESDKTLKAQTNSEKRKELMAKMQAELQQKQIVMQQEYAAKTQKIEEEIIGVVEKVANKKGFKVVMDKSTVIVGGVDITEEVINKLEETEASEAAEEDKSDTDEEKASEEVAEPTEETAEAPAAEAE